MEWYMEEHFSMEWNMEWKIFSTKWKWNGKKLLEWNIEKLSSIPYLTLLNNECYDPNLDNHVIEMHSLFLIKYSFRFISV